MAGAPLSSETAAVAEESRVDRSRSFHHAALVRDDIDRLGLPDPPDARDRAGDHAGARACRRTDPGVATRARASPGRGRRTPPGRPAGHQEGRRACRCRRRRPRSRFSLEAVRADCSHSLSREDSVNWAPPVGGTGAVAQPAPSSIAPRAPASRLCRDTESMRVTSGVGGGHDHRFSSPPQGCRLAPSPLSSSILAPAFCGIGSGAAGVRVWQITSREWSPRRARSPPEGC